MLFRSLLQRVDAFDVGELQARVDLVSDMIVDVLGPNSILGERRCPVITVRKDCLPEELAKRWELYSKPILGGVYQIFTYSCEVSAYEQFCSDLRKGF